KDAPQLGQSPGQSGLHTTFIGTLINKVSRIRLVASSSLPSTTCCSSSSSSSSSNSGSFKNSCSHVASSLVCSGSRHLLQRSSTSTERLPVTKYASPVFVTFNSAEMGPKTRPISGSVLR